MPDTTPDNNKQIDNKQINNKVMLSKYLSLDSYTHSDYATKHNITNALPDELLPSAIKFAQTIYDPLIDLLTENNITVTITSGYRSKNLNQLVKGQPTSQHVKAQAIDIKPIHTDIHKVFDIIKASKLPYDQLILEHDKQGNIWIHCSYATDNAIQRHQVIPMLLKK